MSNRLTTEQIEISIAMAPALEDVEDRRDYQIAGLTEGVKIPESFSLRDKMTPVKNQGARGTCTAFASTGISEYFNTEFEELDLSEEYIFKRTKVIDIADYGYQGYGAYLRSACKAYQKYGICLEESLPYNLGGKEDSWKTISLTEKQTEEGKLYACQGYARVRKDTDSIKRALITTNAPLLAGFTLYESYRESLIDGRVPVADQKTEKLIGGHAMSIVGWDKSWWILKNSWGDWGDEGYLYWPFSGMKHMFSIWSFVDLLDQEDIDALKLEENKKQVPEWGLEAWEKATKKGYVGPQTKFSDVMTKGEWFVLLDRVGKL